MVGGIEYICGFTQDRFTTYPSQEYGFRNTDDLYHRPFKPTGIPIFPAVKTVQDHHDRGRSQYPAQSVRSAIQPREARILPGKHGDRIHLHGRHTRRPSE